MSRKTIGVLALQGSVKEHLQMLECLEEVRPLAVKSVDDLKRVDALILPGGESTTISKLLQLFGLLEPLRARIRSGMPVWGTCAGLILLAREVEGEPPHLQTMDIAVRRNAYGSQLDSFACEAVLPAVDGAALPLVFIRAPVILRIGAGVEALCQVDGHIVAARQDRMLATSFHPELTRDCRMHRFFAQLVPST